MKKFSLLLVVLLCFGIGTARAQYNDMFNFNGTDGGRPEGYLTPSITGDSLFGMTLMGANGDGNVFSIDTNGSNYTDMLDFSGLNGYSPYGSLTLSNSGKVLYGLTFNGGSPFKGNVFSIHTNGSSFRNLYIMNTFIVSWPPGTLTLSPSGGQLFGVTLGSSGGTGCVFSIDTDGTRFKNILNLSGLNGQGPTPGALTLSGFKLYGMTTFGGTNDSGCIYVVDTNGNGYKKLYDFSLRSGIHPEAGVILSGNTLYGTTTYGGTNDSGVVFSIDTNGSNYTVLLNFTGPNGRMPFGSLILYGNRLYGTTMYGGTKHLGTIFSINTDGSGYVDLYNFIGSTGSVPYCSLVRLGNSLYGMTEYGGASNTQGAIFKFKDTSLYVSISATNYFCATELGTAMANASFGTPPYTYLWAPGGQTTALISNLSAGTYTVKVTDSRGSSQTASVNILNTPTTATVNESKDTVFLGNSSQFNASCNDASATYSWSPVTGLSCNTCPNPVATPTVTTIYTVTVTTPCGTIDLTMRIVVVHKTTGIQSAGDHTGGLTIYPNPGSGIFKIIENGELKIENEKQNIEIYNVLGENVYSQFSTFNFPFSIDLSSQPNGVYFYRVITPDGNMIGEGKLIIQK